MLTPFFVLDGMSGHELPVLILYPFMHDAVYGLQCQLGGKNIPSCMELV